MGVYGRAMILLLQKILKWLVVGLIVLTLLLVSKDAVHFNPAPEGRISAHLRSCRVAPDAFPQQMGPPRSECTTLEFRVARGPTGAGGGVLPR